MGWRADVGEQPSSRSVIETALADPEAVGLIVAISEAVVRNAPTATKALPLLTLAARIDEALFSGARDAHEAAERGLLFAALVIAVRETVAAFGDNPQYFSSAPWVPKIKALKKLRAKLEALDENVAGG